MWQEKITFRERFLTSRVWRLWVPRLLAGAVGLILLIAGLAKSTDMELFIRQIKNYGIISHHVVLTFSAWGLIAIECALAVGLLVLYRPRLLLSLTAMLFLTFSVATIWAWLTGATEECGCFGAWLKYTPREGTLENLILLAATVTALMGHRHLQSPRSRVKAWAVTATFLIGLTLPVAFGFPISRINQSPWKTIEMELGRLQIQGMDPIDLTHGAYLLVLMDTECLHCLEVTPELDTLAEATELPAVIALCINEEGERIIFVEKFQPSFPIGQIEEDAFLRLLGYGDVPRTILLRDRHVRRVWDKDVPDKDMIKAALSN
jgi:hypothetical protein